MEERGVLGEQLVHADHVQVLDAEGVNAVQAVQADAPQCLREQQDAGEAKDVGQRRADADTGIVGDSADELRDDQRRDVVDADIAQRRQQHRGYRQPPQPGQLPSVVAKCEEHRAPVRRPSRDSGDLIPTPCCRAAARHVLPWRSCRCLPGRAEFHVRALAQVVLRQAGHSGRARAPQGDADVRELCRMGPAGDVRPSRSGVRCVLSACRPGVLVRGCTRPSVRCSESACRTSRRGERRQSRYQESQCPATASAKSKRFPGGRVAVHRQPAKLDANGHSAVQVQAVAWTIKTADDRARPGSSHGQRQGISLSRR